MELNALMPSTQVQVKSKNELKKSLLMVETLRFMPLKDMF